ncbi:MAG: pesticidal protein Cry7Aa, partial [Candidatus Omnitrophota bacterium]
LDLDDPAKVIGRLKRPLFSPTEDWEKQGDVNNVVFPTGTVLKDGRLYIYYGAADKLIAAKSVDMNELLRELKTQ